MTSTGSLGARVAVLSLLLSGHATQALAQEVSCLDLESPIFGLGGSAAKPLIGRLATALAADDEPITVVFKAPGACHAINAFIDEEPLTGTASYWEPDGTEKSCTFPLEGVPPDYGYMANTPTACPGVAGLPEGLGSFPGPVTAWNLMVPVASTQQSISSEGIYVVYGFGNQSQAAPWTDESQLFSRNPTSAALLALAAASSLPPERFLGIDVETNGNMVTQLSQSPNPEAALGFASGEVADANRATVRTLAYQHKGQTCGYWPDSSAITFDKKNVRDGHYWLWAFHRFYAPVDESGQVANPAVRRFFANVTGSAPDPDIPVLDITIDNGTIPRCAMRVTRDGDYTALKPYADEAPCHCYFESRATGSSSCATCAVDTDCSAAAPHCRHGFCEEE